MSPTSTAPQAAPTGNPVRPSPAHAAQRRRVLGPAASIGVLASILVSLLAASSAPTPLYAIYQRHWGFSPITITVVFGVYAVAVLVSLLVFGKFSDHVGRRPVLLVTLIGQAVAMIVFVTASGVDALLAARVVQGISTGAAVGSLGAGMLDIDPRRGGFLNSFAPAMGTASGAMASGLIVQYLPAPTHLGSRRRIAPFSFLGAASYSATIRSGASHQRLTERGFPTPSLCAATTSVPAALWSRYQQLRAAARADVLVRLSRMPPEYALGHVRVARHPLYGGRGPIRGRETCPPRPTGREKGAK